MNKNISNELIVVTETFFDKIKKFFKKIFNKREVINEEKIEVKKEDVFFNNIKVQENSRQNNLLKLQSLIAENAITEEELTREDVIAMHELYDKQILELKKTIDDYREKILKMKLNK